MHYSSNQSIFTLSGKLYFHNYNFNNYLEVGCQALLISIVERKNVYPRNGLYGLYGLYGQYGLGK